MNTHIASLGGESVECTGETYNDVVAQLMSRHPGQGIPKIVLKAAQAVSDVDANNVSQSGRERSLVDEIAALDNGFAPAPPIYSVGTRVNSIGVDNARRSQEEHASKPLARDVAKSLSERVIGENRRDLDPVKFEDIKLTSQGELVVGATPDETGAFRGGERLLIDPTTFVRVANRLIPARGAGSYLAESPAHLRAKNFNFWSKTASEDATTVLRTRDSSVPGKREIFGAVSEKYTSFDADLIGAALAKALPGDARGSLDYDGTRYRLESLWHTDVAPEEFVAGEFFKAGVIVRGADDGSGSIRVQSVLWRNLCLNLIILDKAIGVDVRIRHMGSVDKLATAFTEAFKKALKSVEPFRAKWAQAMQERDDILVARSSAASGRILEGMAASELLAGLFNGCLERDLVPVRGRTKEVVQDLVRMHAQDEAASAYGLSRASVVNAFTRYAHAVETDPFAPEKIEMEIKDLKKFLDENKGVSLSLRNQRDRYSARVFGKSNGGGGQDTIVTHVADDLEDSVATVFRKFLAGERA